MKEWRVLVVDDDAITQRFFAAALQELGAVAVSAGDGASARAAVGDGVFDLLLIDRHLPDVSGDMLLRTLRDSGCTAPAIATSAEVDDEMRARMLDAAFDEVIAKPISLERLRAVARRFIAQPGTLLDDDEALRALGGHRESLIALRGLLAGELDEIGAEWSNADTLDRPTVVARLHRLRASCGFCGALALSHAAAGVQSAMDEKSSGKIDTDWFAFLALCAATAAALREPR